MDKSEKTYIIERITLGNSIKISAIDPETGLEGVVITPTSLNENDQEILAVKKLRYVLKKHGFRSF